MQHMGAAELQAAAQRVGPVTAGTIMSRNLVTVGPDAPTPRPNGWRR